MTSRFMSMYGELPEVRHKAILDAQKMQKTIIRELSAQGKELPPYELKELIGKGSFGRVYKASHVETGTLVAVKIISIEEGDSIDPTRSDTFSDILKEVNTLKMLNNSGAKNINMVVDSLLVDQSIWMVTEYCAGGSVATLMRPTGGLPEKWIIPILRETAEAIYWVHKEGIIHRDIKCANVLVTDGGGVQLCDFGVAGIMNTRFDKRSTVTGTLQWMAPELFESAAYGTEVDIWAFGSMVYEVASGLPPNATTLQNVANIGRYLKNNCPRLEGDQYSDGLKNMVAYCLVDDPAKRPRIEEIMQHPYIANTEDQFPTASLSKLVKAYRLWETQGGSRRSLFAAGGAQALDDAPPLPPIDDWNFNTMIADSASQQTLEEVTNDPDVSAVYDAYGPDVDFPGAQPPQKNGRRRRRPANLKGPTAPLEKVFDPNTLTNYRDNARKWYGRGESPPMTSDLPLRDEEAANTRESLIDLDMSFEGIGVNAQGDTIRASVQPGADNRRTQEWTFPVMRAGGSGQVDEDAPAVPNFEGKTEIYSQPQQNGSMTSLHSIGGGSQMGQEPVNRASVASLIDLDESLADEYSRPSTSQSDAGFISDAEERFGLEKHTSRRFEVPHTTREPSLYVTSTAQLREPSLYVRSTETPREPSLYVNSTIGGTREPSLYVQDANTTAALNSMANGNLGNPYDEQHTDNDADDDDDGTIEIPDLGDDSSYREPSIYVTSSARTDREPSLYARIDLGDGGQERPGSQMSGYSNSSAQLGQYGYQHNPYSYQSSRQHSRTNSGTMSQQGDNRESGIFIPSFESVRRGPSMIIPDESRTDRQPSLLIPEDMAQHVTPREPPRGQPTSGGYNGAYEDILANSPLSPSPPQTSYPVGPRGTSLNHYWAHDSSVPANFVEFMPAVPFEGSVAPVGPSGGVMEGRGGADELKREMQRLVEGLRDHLGYTGVMLERLPIRRAELRRGREETP